MKKEIRSIKSLKKFLNEENHKIPLGYSQITIRQNEKKSSSKSVEIDFYDCRNYSISEFYKDIVKFK